MRMHRRRKPFCFQSLRNGTFSDALKYFNFLLYFDLCWLSVAVRRGISVWRYKFGTCRLAFAANGAAYVRRGRKVKKFRKKNLSQQCCLIDFSIFNSVYREERMVRKFSYRLMWPPRILCSIKLNPFEVNIGGRSAWAEKNALRKFRQHLSPENLS